jgi:hypothetical protein
MSNFSVISSKMLHVNLGVGGSRRDPYPRAKLLGAVGYPPWLSREGKAPAESGGRGKYSPPANLERVTAKALKRGDKGSSSPNT